MSNNIKAYSFTGEPLREAEATISDVLERLRDRVAEDVQATLTEYGMFVLEDDGEDVRLNLHVKFNSGELCLLDLDGCISETPEEIAREAVRFLRNDGRLSEAGRYAAAFERAAAIIREVEK